MRSIDLNCDMGESTAARPVGDDAAIMPWVSSANIACGYHGGDPEVMRETVRLAMMHGVAIGAHPSFFDIEGFGRAEMNLSPAEIYNLVSEQVNVLRGFTPDGKLHHVKPHGALYNMAARIPSYAEAIAKAVKEVDDGMILYGLSGSHLISTAKKNGLRTCSEVFADRTYQPDGSLTPRSSANAIIHEAQGSIEQVMMMIKEGKVRAVDGTMVNIEADTICIHGDHPGAAVFAKALHQALHAEGFIIQPMKR